MVVAKYSEQPFRSIQRMPLDLFRKNSSPTLVKSIKMNPFVYDFQTYSARLTFIVSEHLTLRTKVPLVFPERLRFRLPGFVDCID